MSTNFSGLVQRLLKGENSESPETGERDFCLVCDSNLMESQSYLNNKVCPNCQFHYSMTARERIEFLTDKGTFRETNKSLSSLDPLSFSSRTSYKEQIFRDQRRTGLTEAVVTGSCKIGGISCVLVVLDFGFMGGTMGCVVGEKISLAFERATKRNLPVISVITSGGSRIQEGILSLMQMAKTSVTSNKLHEKGIPYISILANPATGQAFASFANTADIILAEPGAIVGYSPLRTVRESQDNVAENAHTSESQLQHGMIDAVADRTKLKEIVSVLLDLLQKEFKIHQTGIRDETSWDSAPTGAWHSVQLARHSSRPTAMDLMARMMDDFVELHGDRMYGDDLSVVCGLGHLGGQTVAVIGQERSQSSSSGLKRHDGQTLPEGFRKAQRTLLLAEKFEIPIITLIDTPGVNLSTEAETRGIGNAIASTMAMMSDVEIPTLSIVIGEGGSAGALALGTADKLLMMENAIYTAVSPEDAAQVLYQDECKAQDAAESLKLTAFNCHELGIIDKIVPEPEGGAHTNHHEAARLLKRNILRELADLQKLSKRSRHRKRYKKFRNIGEYSSFFRSTIAREVNVLRGTVARKVREFGIKTIPND